MKYKNLNSNDIEGDAYNSNIIAILLVKTILFNVTLNEESEKSTELE